MASGDPGGSKMWLSAPAVMSKTAPILVRPDLKNYIGLLEPSETDKKLRCLVLDCTQKFAYSSKSGWSNCIAHLVNVHKLAAAQFTHKKSNCTTGPLDLYIDPSLQQMNKKDCYARGEAKQVLFEKDVMDMVAIAGVPLELTDHPTFVKTIKHLDPKIRRLSRRTLGRRFAQDIVKIKTDMIAKLGRLGEGQMHLTFDLWSSSSHKSVLGIKVHFIENWVLRTFTIGFKHFRDRKDAQNIRESICTLMASFGMLPYQVGIIMGDNASENVKAFSMRSVLGELPQAQAAEDPQLLVENEAEFDDEPVELLDDGAFAHDIVDIPSENEDITDAEMEAVLREFEDWSTWNFTRLGCIAHALQLVINECLKKNSQTQHICNTIVELVSFFNRSTFWTTKLLLAAKLNLVRPGTTRWNSTLYALQRITKPGYVGNLNKVLMEATNAAKTSAQRKTIPGIVGIDLLEEMEELTKILSCLEEFTQRIQGDSVTSSLVIPGLISIYKAVASIDCQSDSIQAFQANLCRGITERFGAPTQASYSGRGARKQLLQVFTSKPYILSAMLDPRIKTSPFTVKLPEPYGLEEFVPSKEVAVNILKEEFMKNVAPDQQAQPELPDFLNDSDSDVVPAKKMRDIIFDLIDDNRTGSDGPPKEADMAAELRQYLSLPAIQKQDDPLKWWKQNAPLFPHLSQMAVKYLSFPASTGGVERVFSIAGSIARHRRNGITMDTLETLLQYREYRLSQMRKKRLIRFCNVFIIYNSKFRLFFEVLELQEESNKIVIIHYTFTTLNSTRILA